MKKFTHTVILGLIFILPFIAGAAQVDQKSLESDAMTPRRSWGAYGSRQLVQPVRDIAGPNTDPAIGQVAYTDVTIASNIGESPFEPELTIPQFSQDFLFDVKNRRDYPGQLANMFSGEKDIYQMCRKPFVISYVDTDMTVDSDYDCAVIFAGQVVMKPYRGNDKVLLVADGHRIILERDSTLIVFGMFKDETYILPISERAASECDRCSTKNKLTTCKMKTVPFPACFVEEFSDIEATVIRGQYYMRSYSCHHYVEGSGDIDVSARSCSIRVIGPGPAKINANCSVSAQIDAYDEGVAGAIGKHTIYISGDGDAWIEALGGDKVFINDGVNIIFSYNDLQSVDVVTSRENNPCMRAVSLIE